MSRVLAAAGIGAIVLYLIIPVIVVVALSLSSGNYLSFPPPGYSTRWYQAIANDPEWVGSFLVTIRVGLISAFFATLIGVPAAFALVRFVIPIKPLVNALILCALVTPSIVAALSTYLFFVQLGLVNSEFWLACAHTVSGLPFVVINVAASLRSADQGLERAAIIHGAPPLWAIMRITVPIIMPGIVIGSIFAFVHSAHELLISVFVLGGVGKPVSVKMWSDVQANADPTVAAASTLLIGLAVLTFASVTLTQTLTKRRTT